MDGTLLDTMPVWRNSGARFLASLGIQAERGLGEKLFSETVETGAKYIVDKYRLEMSAQDVADGIDAQVAHAYESEAGFKPGAEKLLNTLKWGFCSAYSLYAERSEERRVGKECRSRWSPYH